MRGWRGSTATLLGACALLASACGTARQDAHEPSGTYALQVVGTSFPPHQWISRPTSFELRVHNSGARTAPSMAVTLDSFSYVEKYPALASSKRPVWVIEQGPGPIASRPVESEAISPPGGGQTAYVNTWSLGPLAPGHTQTLIWRVVPVKSGSYTVHYAIAAGLAGKAKAQTKRGGAVRGHLTADIAPRPPARHVNPTTGRVVPGALQLAP